MYSFDDAIFLLIDKFPMLGSVYKEYEYLYKDSQFVFYGVEFIRYIIDVANQRNTKELQTIFDFVEDMLVNGDETTQNLIEVEIVERLFLKQDEPDIEELKLYFGKLTMKSYKECFE
ncbi:MAG: hypothetical protein JEZ00_19535 [Anaerolineaceae bacterium]|nr:hypothetical protein [Anaerolineaceae bacterium]